MLLAALKTIRQEERIRRELRAKELRHLRETERDAQTRSYFSGGNRTTSQVVAYLNKELTEKCRDLDNILSDGLSRWVDINWAALKRTVDERDLEKFGELEIGAPPSPKNYVPEKPVLIAFRFGARKRYRKALDDAQLAFRQAEENFASRIEARHQKMLLLESDALEYNRQLGAFRDAYARGEPDAVDLFFDMAFGQSRYPEDFPEVWRFAYLPESRHLITDIDLPTIDTAIPKVERYRDVKSSAEISETKKSLKAQKSLYSSVVAQVVLRRLYEIFKSDQEEIVSVATINAFVDAIDPATGQFIRPCLISVRTTRDGFRQLDLRHVDPPTCLKRLNAVISRSPSELVAVRPIHEIDLVDSRFIEEADILSNLDTRSNLMELSPGEFENLITNLFQKMGLETKLTRPSRDGGVDCVAFDPRPVLGGKVIVQAKRYKNTVGVSAVRDLFGTMHNEGASKGILVTTSGYGTAAYEFANNKPIELMTGGNLLYLLKEHAGIDAKIVMPEDWQDQKADQ
ncbi:MAG TPA: restriction endonuclease [Methylocystis sp.]|nr:restriction endonuclease [Methylocystis sp.]